MLVTILGYASSCVQNFLSPHQLPGRHVLFAVSGKEILVAVHLDSTNHPHLIISPAYVRTVEIGDFGLRVCWYCKEFKYGS